MSAGMAQLPIDPQPSVPVELCPELALAEELLPVEELDDADLAEELTEALERDPDLWLYRHRTLALLRRYMRLSVEVGRLPSLLGRELFCTRITRYKVATFEDTVIFVHDVEQALDELDEFERALIAKLVMQDHSQDEVSRLMDCDRRTVGRRFPETLDRLSEIFLEGHLLTPLPFRNSIWKKSCQEAKNDEISVSDSEESKYKVESNVPFSL